MDACIDSIEHQKRSKSESNPDLRVSSSGNGEENHKSLLNGTTEKNKDPPGTTLYALVIEVMDIILQKSFLHWILNPSTKQNNEEMIKSLISVDVCFNRRITRQRFKQAIDRCLKAFYAKTRRRSAVIRNNRTYLLENIQPTDKLIASLLSLDCITKEQHHFIQRQRSKRYMNAELLYLMKSFDNTKSSNLLKCLRQSNHGTLARILENGGGVIKVEVQNRGANGTASVQSQLLHQKIIDLRNRTKPRLHQTDKLISQLKDEGIEILNSQLDRHIVVVWIWCHSQEAIEYIQKLYDSNKLKDILFENIQPSTSKVIRIDRNEFKKTIVVCSVAINFTRSIKIRSNEAMCGVTRLRNEIYVLCRTVNPKYVIGVFENRNRFERQRKIPLTDVGSCTDIGSCEKENCLYISDSTRRCIWKLTGGTDDEHKIIKWLTTDYQPMTLSVSTGGQLLMVNNSSSILVIYGPNAELIRSIQLSTNIKSPIHAVETSVGNVIVLCNDFPENGKKGQLGGLIGREQTKWVLSELNGDGQMVIRRIIPSNEAETLIDPRYLSLDSDDRVFVADYLTNRVILLDSDLKCNRILCPTKEEEEEGANIVQPHRLCYDEEEKQLIVGGTNFLGEGIQVYTLRQQ